jgi:DNA-binding phage protein
MTTHPNLRAQLSPLIRAKGISQTARESGVHRVSLHHWLAGRRELPMRDLEALARAVGLRLQHSIKLTR